MKKPNDPANTPFSHGKTTNNPPKQKKTIINEKTQSSSNTPFTHGKKTNYLPNTIINENTNDPATHHSPMKKKPKSLSKHNIQGKHKWSSKKNPLIHEKKQIIYQKKTIINEKTLIQQQKKKPFTHATTTTNLPKNK